MLKLYGNVVHIINIMTWEQQF